MSRPYPGPFVLTNMLVKSGLMSARPMVRGPDGTVAEERVDGLNRATIRWISRRRLCAAVGDGVYR
jgi:hypothetical protein